MGYHVGTVLLVAGLLACAPAPAAGAGTGVEVPSGSPAATASAIPVTAAGLVSPLPEPSMTPATDGLVLWLRGPFGRVSGGDLAEPASAAPRGQPLDTYTRDAPLRLEVSGVDLLTRLTVTSRSLVDAAAVEVLSHGAPDFAGPGQPGRSVVVAEVTTATGDVGRFAWLVHVPDREPPADGLYDIPAPGIIVESASGSRAGLTGSGCYAYLCVEAGRTPPQEVLPALAAQVGETLRLRLADGSAMTAWQGRLWPLPGTAGAALDAGGALTDTPEGTLELAGLEPPGAGSWVLDLEVEFDRERGWMRTLYRLDVSAPEPAGSDADGAAVDAGG